MRILLTCLFFLPVSFAFAQLTDTVYLDKARKRTVHKDSSVFVQYLIYKNQKKTEWNDNVFYVTGEKDFEGHYRKQNDKIIREGTFRNWYKNGKLSAEYTYKENKLEGKSSKWYETGQLKTLAIYKDGLREGEVLTYYINGKLKRSEQFAKGILAGGKSFTKTGIDTAFVPTLVNPKYPGGAEALAAFISNNLIYPNVARKKRIQGLVKVQFIIDRNGDVTKPEVTQKMYPALDEEALRIVKAFPKFGPALEEGEPVTFRYTLPIRFGLN